MQDEKEDPYAPTYLYKDTRVTKLNHGGMILVETCDILPAVVDNPYLMGKIAYTITLRGIHSLGLSKCSSTKMILAVPDSMKDDERKIVVPMMIRGYVDAARASDSSVKDCQIFQNPWCLLGGTATVVCQPYEIVQPVDAIVGDVIVLTKPLGTTMALTISEWMKQPEKRSRLILAISEESVEKAHARAVDCMVRSNRIAAVLMRKVSRFNIYIKYDNNNNWGYQLNSFAISFMNNNNNNIIIIIIIIIYNKLFNLKKELGKPRKLINLSLD